ncbi:hypothetical protein ACEPAF_3638 [Sanghuangporus sanghuang]
MGEAPDTAARNNNIRLRRSRSRLPGWMYWQVIPNAGPHYVDPSWDTLKEGSEQALLAPAAFDYSDFLL